MYFRGSTIELHCHVSCEQECILQNKIYHDGYPELYHELTDNKRKLTLKINNANLKDSGFYQCFRLVWPWKSRVSEIAGRRIHVEITGGLCGSTCACVTVCLCESMLLHVVICYFPVDLSPAEHEVKFISKGDSAFLPCTVNASNNVYPKPDGIEWWKDDNRIEYGVRC